MKNKNPAAPDDSATPAEVVSTTPASAMAAVYKGPEPLAPGASVDDRIMHARERLQAVAEGSPFEEQLYEISSNMAPAIKGMEGSTGISLPVISLRQKATGEDSVPERCKVGEMYTKQGEVFGNKIDFVPIRSHFKRTRFVQGQQAPDCQSDDGVTGSKYGACENCVYKRFEEGAKNPNACRSGTSVTGVIDGFANGKLYQIDFMKKSAPAGKKLKTLAIPPALYAIKVQIFTEKETNKDGQDYYVLKVRPTGNKTDAGERAAADAICDFLQARAEGFKARRGNFRMSAGSAPAGALPSGDVSATPDENPDLGGSI